MPSRAVGNPAFPSAPPRQRSTSRFCPGSTVIFFFFRFAAFAADLGLGFIFLVAFLVFLADFFVDFDLFVFFLALVLVFKVEGSARDDAMEREFFEREFLERECRIFWFGDVGGSDPFLPRELGSSSTLSGVKDRAWLASSFEKTCET